MTNILIGYIRKWKCDVGVKKKKKNDDKYYNSIVITYNNWRGMMVWNLTDNVTRITRVLLAWVVKIEKKYSYYL